MFTKFLTRISQSIRGVGSDAQEYRKYQQLRDFEGWKIHVKYLILLRGMMAEELLSPSFSRMSPYDKDVCQRAYAGVNQMIEFLIDPTVQARKLTRIDDHHTRIGAKLEKSTTPTRKKGVA